MARTKIDVAGGMPPVRSTVDDSQAKRHMDRVRVVVRGPTDPVLAAGLRRALVRDLAALAVDLLAEGRLKP